MRTTLNIADTTHEIASVYARSNGITLGAAVDELIQKAVTPAKESSLSPRLKRLPNGMVVIRAAGRKKLTNEMVRKMLEEDGY